MRMHEVEVDHEVFSYVQERAEPLVDTFNTAIRKLLHLSPNSSPKLVEVRSRPEKRDGGFGRLSFPAGTPKTLQQVLEVTQLVRSGAYPRTDATTFVAKQRGIRPQTVQDKYWRRLGLKNVLQFDRMLEEEDLTSLRRCLLSKFPEHGALIETSLGAGGTSE